MIQTIERIDEKCAFCGKKAEYFFFRKGYFRTTWFFLCEEHKLLINKVGFYKFKNYMNPIKHFKETMKKFGYK